MERKNLNQFHPNYASPPGDTLLETLETIGMSQAELAERTGRPKKTINEIIKGRASITPETALQLERVLGIPASFWNNRESQYREIIATLEEQELLENHLDWLKNFPLRQMIKMGWINRFEDKVNQLKELLRFFGVASPHQWSSLWESKAARLRKSPSFQSNPYAVAAWLRRGEIEAHSVKCKPFDQKAFRAALNKIRVLSNEPPEVFVPETERLCADAGVALVFVPELRGTRASGATRWLNNIKALIQLSLRYGSDDHLWFTFFHEAGHILLHPKKAAFLECDKMEYDELEKEADKFAADILLPAYKFRRFINSRHLSKESIIDLAHEISISPGIVVGRLQHDGYLPYNRFNDLKERFVLTSSA
jgi:HTH-type transcriptional regulator/antitoxin HigA